MCSSFLPGSGWIANPPHPPPPLLHLLTVDQLNVLISQAVRYKLSWRNFFLFFFLPPVVLFNGMCVVCVNNGPSGARVSVCVCVCVRVLRVWAWKTAKVMDTKDAEWLGVWHSTARAPRGLRKMDTNWERA